MSVIKHQPLTFLVDVLLFVGSSTIGSQKKTSWAGDPLGAVSPLNIFLSSSFHNLKLYAQVAIAIKPRLRYRLPVPQKSII